MGRNIDALELLDAAGIRRLVRRRSAAELHFRLNQELFNFWLYLRPPDLRSGLPGPPGLLPEPAEAAGGLRSTEYARELEQIADKILRHEFQILGTEIHTGPEIRWRKDYLHELETEPIYFRRIPYLDPLQSGDHKTIWELNRHQHLVVLAQAWLLTGRPEFRNEIPAQIDTWLIQNPFQRGINWASALEVAFRVLSWIWIDHLAGRNWDQEFRRRFLRALYQHGLHLERNLSIYFSPNTHVLGEAVALHALGLLYPKFPRAAHWVKRGHAVVLEQIQKQIREDGSHFEQSSYYHVYALDMFLFHAVLAEAGSEYRRKLTAMADYLNSLLGKERSLPLIGDDDGGRFFYPYGDRSNFGRASLATASIFLDRQWFHTATDLSEQAAWWIGAKAFGAGWNGPPVETGSHLFPDSGMAVMTCGNIQICVDAGPFGPGTAGHSHSDTLAIVVRAGTEEILIDSGTYTYVAEPQWRERFRGSAAHNTIRIHERDQALARGPFGWSEKPDVELQQWATNPNEDILQAACRYAGFVHQRRVHFQKPGILEIADKVTGPPGEHLVEQFWHPGEPTIQTGPHCFQIGGAASFTFDTACECELGEGGEFGWRSRALGSKQLAPVIRVWIRTPLPISLRSVITFK